MTRARVTALAVAAASALVVLVALDRVVAWLDLGYVAARGRPHEARRLVRDEFATDVGLNALGFRDDRLPGTKPAGTVRVVALGDSFTQGFGVDAALAWPARVERLLAADGGRYEVVNLGVPGANPVDHLANLRDPGLAYEPDHVVVMVMANDVQERWVQRRFGVGFASGVLVEARRSVVDPPPVWTALPRTVLPALYPFVRQRMAGLLADEAHATPPSPATAPARPGTTPAIAREILLAFAARHDRRDAVAARLERLPPETLQTLAPVLGGDVALDAPEAIEPYLRLMALVEPRLFADAVLLPPAYDDAWADVAATLTRLVAVARAAGARPMIVFAPGVQQVTPAARPELERLGFAWDDRTLDDTTFVSRLRGVAQANDVRFVDLLAPLRARRETARDYYPRDGHWTPTGHALAAAHIAGGIRE